MEVSQESTKKESKPLFKEETVNDPEVDKVIREFERQLIQKEIKTSLANKKNSGDEEKDRKENAKSAYIRFMFVKIETNIAKRHANTDPTPCHILDDLFIGSIGSASNKENLKKTGITHIISCLDFTFMPFEGDFKYLHIPVLDSPAATIDQYFEQAHEFYQQAKKEDGKVFVHCFAGVSRSSTVACSIVMKELLQGRDTALQAVKANRAQVKPNQGFWAKLLDWEKKTGLSTQQAMESMEEVKKVLEETDSKEPTPKDPSN